MQKLKKRWGIESNLQLFFILVVFAVTGSASVYVAKPFLELLQIKPSSFPEAWWGQGAYWTLRILLIFPFYQLLLLLFGWVFGQFRFFWNFEKKMLQRTGLGRIFNRH